VEVYLILFLVGIVSGFAAGLFGIGGGVILVPIFNYFFSLKGVSEEIGFKLSVATSLSVITVSTLFTSGLHIFKGKVEFGRVLRILPYIFSGILLGVLFSHLVSGSFLKRFFGVFLLLLSFKILAEKKGVLRFNLKESVLFPFTSLLSAFLSALLGIGGGVVVNTLMFSFSEMEVKTVVAFASVLSFINAFLGTLLYLLVPAERVLSYQVGYIYLPAALFVSIGGLIGSRLGVNILHTVEQKLLKRLFGVLLFLIGLRMLMK
jgi:uncharacterized membrane protein YfcA